MSLRWIRCVAVTAFNRGGRVITRNVRTNFRFHLFHWNISLPLLAVNNKYFKANCKKYICTQAQSKNLLCAQMMCYYNSNDLFLSPKFYTFYGISTVISYICRHSFQIMILKKHDLNECSAHRIAGGGGVCIPLSCFLKSWTRSSKLLAYFPCAFCLVLSHCW